MNENFTIICPCCEATLTIDKQTGAILSHEGKSKKLESFDDLQRNLKQQSETRENIFAQEMEAQKNRQRLLDEKFRQALSKDAELSEDEKRKPFQNPLDVD
ncbi:MAG: 2-nitropropane dioxygenase [Pyrinomonadaceae bacterium]|nr:2-nitropropane dioxygenase [Pyrinomonadaceae bacterium]